LDYVRELKGDLRFIFESPQGKSLMSFLEMSCGWYESIFDPVNRDIILMNAGKREVCATIKTLLKCSPDEIVAIVKRKEE